MERLNFDFFHRPCLEVARDLVGKVLVRRTEQGEICLRISETEAYCGEADTACHLGTDSCFTNPIFGEEESKFQLESLYQLLLGRKKDMPEGSYTTYLFQKGLDKILKKVGEETTEVIIAAKAEDKAETVYEIADLAYHILVLMAQQGITVEDIRKELAGRHVIDHKVKQEKMT